MKYVRPLYLNFFIKIFIKTLKSVVWFNVHKTLCTGIKSNDRFVICTNSKNLIYEWSQLSKTPTKWDIFGLTTNVFPRSNITRFKKRNIGYLQSHFAFPKYCEIKRHYQILNITLQKPYMSRYQGKVVKNLTKSSIFFNCQNQKKWNISSKLCGLLRILYELEVSKCFRIILQLKHNSAMNIWIKSIKLF